MTQETKEVYEFVHIKCGKKYILDSEPDENFTCEICGPDKEPEKFSLDKPWVGKSRRLRGDYWTCGNHSTVQKWGVECPECLKNVKPPLSRIMTDSEIAKENEMIQDEIGMGKVERQARDKITKRLIALQEGQLETPNLLKQQLKQQGKILKALEQLNKNLEDKNGS